MLTRPQQALALAILVGAGALRAWAISNETLHDWDEAYHALVAKRLAVHPLLPTLYDDAALPHDDSSWTRARVFLNKPPLALWTMAASLRLLGSSVAAARLPSALLDLGSVWLTLAIALRLLGARVGLGAMGLHALSGSALLLVGGVHATDHVDVQLAFWVELAVWGVVRQQQSPGRWPWLVGAATGAALLTKSAPGALPLLLLGAAGGKGWRENARAAVVAASIALALAIPWNLYARARWPELSAAAASAQLSHLWRVWEDHQGHPLFYFEKLGELHGVLVLIPVGWFVVRALRGGWAEPGARLVALWVLVPVTLFSFAATKMPNYLAIAAGAVWMMTAAFAVAAFEGRPVWVKALAGAVVVAALVTDGRELRRLGPSTADEAQFAGTMRALPPRTVVLGVRPAIQAMFHGAHAAYREPWAEEQRARASRDGYQVLTASCDGGPGLPLPAGFCAEP